MARGLDPMGPWRRWGRWSAIVALVGLATAGLPGCGGDSNESGVIMRVDMTFTPNPTAASPSAEDAFEWVAPYQVTLREMGGLGGTITNINVNTYEVADGGPGVEAVASTSVLEYPSTRLDAGGTLELTFNTFYTLSNGESAAFIDVFVFVIDDDGFSGQVGNRLTVQ